MRLVNFRLSEEDITSLNFIMERDEWKSRTDWLRKRIRLDAETCLQCGKPLECEHRSAEPRPAYVQEYVDAAEKFLTADDVRQAIADLRKMGRL